MLAELHAMVLGAELVWSAPGLLLRTSGSRGGDQSIRQKKRFDHCCWLIVVVVKTEFSRVLCGVRDLEKNQKKRPITPRTPIRVPENNHCRGRQCEEFKLEMDMEHGHKLRNLK
jgi:hypothetical protein